MAYNKIVYGNETLIDLTGDTVTKATVLSGVTFHGKDGEADSGACTYDSDTSGDTVTEDEILSGKTAHARGAELTGRMTNVGKQTGSISTKNGTVNINQGYHDGSGSVGLSATEKAKIIPSNIRAGVELLGVTGEMSGSEDVKAQAKAVTPTKTGFSVNPDSGFNYLSGVTVNPIPYVESTNSAGGTTVTIG